LTWALPILVGVVCYLWWRRSTIRPEPVAAADPGPAAQGGGRSGQR
jgi:hypothetical protein